MSMLVRSIVDLFRRAWVRLLALLGVTFAGIATQALIFLLTNFEGDWFRPSTWTRKKNRRSLKNVVRTSLLVSSVWAGLYVSLVVVTVRDDQRAVHAQVSMLLGQNKALIQELNQWKTHAAQPKAKAETRVRDIEHPSTETLLAATVEKLDEEIMSSSRAAELSRPTQVFSSLSPEVTRKSMADDLQFQQVAVMDFIRRFAGPIYLVERDCQKLGIDTSHLDGHLTTLNGVMAFRLIAIDLKGIEEELKRRDASRPS